MFGLNVKHYRERAKMTQKELAEKIGVSSPMVTQIERGTKQATAPIIEAISEVFGVSTDELIKGRAAL